MIDLDLSTGKGVTIAVAAVVAVVVIWAAASMLTIALLLAAIVVFAYGLYAVGVRINRRAMGRSGGGR